MSYVGEIGINLYTWNWIELKKWNGFVYTEEEEHVIQGSYGTVGWGSSLNVTTLPILLTKVIVEVDM